MAKKAPTKKTAPKTQPAAASRRKLPQPQYKSFRMSKPIKQAKPVLPGSFRIFKEALKLLWQRKKLFFWLVILAFIFNTIFVRGVSASSSLTDLKGVLDGIFTNTSGKFTASLALFSVLLSGSATSQTETSTLYQGILTIVFSLAFIWAIRHSMADAKARLRVRDAFYRGMYPLVPFLAVLAVIGLQLIPLGIANFLYSSVIGGGLAVTMLEKILWLLFIGLLALLTFYMMTSSVFALYIVTLADVDPLQALRSARELVRFRRWTIMRKLLFLPFSLLLIGAVIIMPLILVAPVLAEWLFYLLSMAALLVVHSYVYHLYRKLL